MALHDFTLYDVLLRNAQSYGQRLALVTETGEERSFAELLQRVDRLATGLSREGLARGDRVCILALNSAAYFELYLACARQGLVAYPINWRLQTEEIARIVERAQPRAFVSDDASSEQAPEGPETDSVSLWIDLDSTTTGNSTGRGIGKGRERSDPCPIASLYADSEPAPPAEVTSDDAFAVIATAAVDVIPRCAVLSHGNLVCANLQEIAALSLTPDDRNLVALPLFHIAGLGHCLSFFHVGGANVITPRFDADLAVELIDGHRVTHVSDFPPVLISLLDAAAAAGTRLPSLRYVSGLDSPEAMERLHEETDATFWTGFGQCETSGFVTLQNARERLGCAGKAGELCAVKLVDDYGREVPAGAPGEIVVRGPLVFQGYDGQPEVTEHTFRGGWHHTGDVGRFDEEGNLFYVKRKADKELIKPGGENVYPAEVESVIAELEAVVDVCVFGVPDTKWGEAIRAVIQLSAGAELDAEAVREHVGDRIARFKRPQHVDFTAELPRTDDGAVDREAVKERWQ